VALDSTLRLLPVGRGEVLKEGGDIALVAIGSMVNPALKAAEILGSRLSCTVVNARFAKPIDRAWLIDALRGISLIVTIEENVIAGGFGTGIQETLEGETVSIRHIGIPDLFPGSGSMEYLRKTLGLTPEGIAQKIEGFWHNLRAGRTIQTHASPVLPRSN